MSRSPKSKWYDGQRRLNETGKCIRENTAFCLRTPKRDDHSGVLIGAGGTCRSDWSVHVLVDLVAYHHLVALKELPSKLISR